MSRGGYGARVLTQAEVRNFRSLRKGVNVPLRAMTVLIGENDTGKSTFLEALARLSPGTHVTGDGWRGNGVGYIRAMRDGREIKRGDAGQSGEVQVGIYQLPPSGPSMRSEGVGGVLPALERSGGLVPSVIDWLLRKDRGRFDQLVKTIVERVPGLVDIGIETPTASTREVHLKLDEGYWLAADRASAGVRLLLFFLTLAHHPDPPELVLLEEPENGLHPHRLSYVMKILRGLTEGAFGAKPVQVIVSTHSPHLLDEVDPAKDQVLVFKRLPDGSRTAEPADAARLATFLDEFKLGEVWFNQREEGLVARPGGA